MIRREHRGPRVVAVRAVALMLCSGLVLGSEGTAFAADPEPGGVIRVNTGIDVSGMRDIAVSGIAPGYQDTWSVTVVNERAEPVTIGLRLEDLANDDNGCGAPEAREDDTCGDGEGELGAHLVMGVGVPGNERQFSAALDDAGPGSGQIVTVPGGGETEVLIGLWLPSGTGNVVQTDSVAFTLVWRAEAIAGERGDPVEGGVDVRSDAAGNSGDAGLALTGARVMLIAGLALVLIAGGTLLVLVLRKDGDRGRHRPGGTGLGRRPVGR